MECSIWVDSATIGEEGDAFRGEMMRRMKRVYCQSIMRNEACDGTIPPLHMEVTKRRLPMVGYIARQTSPANRKLAKLVIIKLRMGISPTSYWRRRASQINVKINV